MRMTNVRNSTLNSDLKINKQTITTTQDIKLEAIIDKNLTFEHHVKNVKSKIDSKRCYTMRTYVPI